MSNLKKIIGSLIVLGLLIGGMGVLQAIGEGQKETKSTKQGIKKEERLKPKIQQGLKPNERLKSKLQQVGTPTVQQLLDKVKANYHKIKDLKADYKWKTRDTHFAKAIGILGDLVIQKEKFFFKAPDKLKWIPPNVHLTVIIKDNIEYQKRWKSQTAKEDEWYVYDKKLYWYYLLEPDRLDFYWRLDEIITKFDSRVISHPTTDVWVIEAVPKTSNPDDEYNYPWSPRWGLEIYIDYSKGVITQIFDFDAKTGGDKDLASEYKNIQLINNVWIPTTLIKIGAGTEEITLSNIQLNTGIPDSEFEF